MRRSPPFDSLHYVDDASGCWNWTGHVRADGYGAFRSRYLAHRVAYERANGCIPAGLQIDHLCRNRRCVNPAHLEAVTQRENLLRGETLSARNARKTVCVRGHPLTGDNVRWTPEGQRNCRACATWHARRYYRENTNGHRDRELAAKKKRLATDPAYREAKRLYLIEYRKRRREMSAT